MLLLLLIFGAGLLYAALPIILCVAFIALAIYLFKEGLWLLGCLILLLLL